MFCVCVSGEKSDLKDDNQWTLNTTIHETRDTCSLKLQPDEGKDLLPPVSGSPHVSAQVSAQVSHWKEARIVVLRSCSTLL